MKAFVLGYKTRDGSGPAEVVAGPEVSHNQQLAIIRDAKGGKFPKGIKYLAFSVLEEREVAIAHEKTK